MLSDDDTTEGLAEEGVWLAMKGKRPDAEIAALPEAAEVFHVEQLQVPELAAERCIVWMRKRPDEEMGTSSTGDGR